MPLQDIEMAGFDKPMPQALAQIVAAQRWRPEGRGRSPSNPALSVKSSIKTNRCRSSGTLGTACNRGANGHQKQRVTNDLRSLDCLNREIVAYRSPFGIIRRSRHVPEAGLLGIAEDEPLSLDGRSGLPPQPASAAVASAIGDNSMLRFDIAVS